MSIATRTGTSVSRTLLFALLSAASLGPGCTKNVAYPSGVSYAESEGGPFVLENASQLTICYVKIRLAEAAETDEANAERGWGPDQLEVAEVLRTGSRRSWHLPAGRYDLLLEDCNRRLLDEQRSLEVTEEGGWFTLRELSERGG